MPKPAAPRGLDARGRRLWREVVDRLDGELDPAQRELLVEACRMADRLDRLDAQLRGGDWLRLDVDEGGELVVRVDAALAAASRDANVLKQLLTALRLPDEQTGKRPQYRGPRGAQRPSVPGGRAASSSRDRLRAVTTG